MIRSFSGLVLLIAAIATGIIILRASVLGNSAVQELEERYGPMPTHEWYNHQPARDLFHGEMRNEAEVLYQSFWIAPLGIVVTILGLCLGCIHTHRRLKHLCFIAGVIAFVILVVPWIFHGASIAIIQTVVE
jgi:ABC-type spermidine/putrescine transport system permease subunit II